MSKQIDRILEDGVLAGMLARVEEAPTHAPRPWPLTLLSGIGAWFAAIPFAVLLFLISLLGGSEHASLLAVLGTICLCAATIVLRARPPLFIEQLALAGMVAGALVLYFYIAKKGNATMAALCMCAAFTAAACIVPQTWLRVLLGAVIGSTGILGLHGVESFWLIDGGAKLGAVLAMSVCWCVFSALSSCIMARSVDAITDTNRGS